MLGMLNTINHLMLKTLVVCSLFCSASCIAAIDAYPFPTDELQQRYDALIDELRCPQCLNTNLAGSDAMIAQGLRREVHRLLLEGSTDEEILEFMYQRYGNFILYRPRLSPGTSVLWFGPILLLILAGYFVFRLLRSKRSVTPLTAAQQARIDALVSHEER